MSMREIIEERMTKAKDEELLGEIVAEMQNDGSAEIIDKDLDMVLKEKLEKRKIAIELVKKAELLHRSSQYSMVYPQGYNKKMHVDEELRKKKEGDAYLEEAKKIIEKKLKEEEKNRRLKEEQERKEKADNTRRTQIEEVNKAKEIESENLKIIEEKMLSKSPEEEKKDQS